MYIYLIVWEFIFYGVVTWSTYPFHIYFGFPLMETIYIHLWKENMELVAVLEGVRRGYACISILFYFIFLNFFRFNCIFIFYIYIYDLKNTLHNFYISLHLSPLLNICDSILLLGTQFFCLSICFVILKK